MIIVCPTCSASYEIPAASLGATGRSVRCTSCKTVWFNPPEETDTIISEQAGAKIPAVVNLPANAAKKAVPPPEKEKPAVPAAPSIPVVVAKRKPSVSEEKEADDDGDTEVAFSEVTPDPDAEIPKKTKRGWFRRKEKDQIPSVPRVAKHNGAAKEGRTPFWMTLCLFVGVAGLFWMVAKRDSVAAFLPEMAHLYQIAGLKVNVQGLDLQNVKTLETVQDGLPMLIIEGVIKNVTTHSVDIPRLRLAVQAQDGRELFAWTAAPALPKLDKAGEIPFKAQLASPPLDGKKVAVRFLTRHDNVMRKE